MNAIDVFLESNARYAATFRDSGVPVRPSKELAVVTCMDARMDLFAMLGLRAGDAHVIRNAGGVVTDDVLRSLVISQRLLGTREVMLIKHTDCGMTKFTDEEMRAALQSETGVRPPFSMRAFEDPDTEARRSLAELRGSPFLPHRDAIRAFVYDVDTGRLHEVA